MNKHETTQTAFILMQQLASLAATSNVSAENIEVANEQINSLLTKIIKPTVSELTAAAAGLIVK